MLQIHRIRGSLFSISCAQRYVLSIIKRHLGWLVPTLYLPLSSSLTSFSFFPFLSFSLFFLSRDTIDSGHGRERHEHYLHRPRGDSTSKVVTLDCMECRHCLYKRSPLKRNVKHVRTKREGKKEWRKKRKREIRERYAWHISVILWK